MSEYDELLEEGRRLASQRDDLIAQGVNPAELLSPLAPTEPPKENVMKSAHAHIAPRLARRVGYAALLLAVVAALAVAGAWVAAPAHGAQRHVVIGASGGAEIEQLSAAIDRTVPAHKYVDLTDSPVSDVRYLNIEAERPGEWAAIARGEYDAQISSWANALAATHRDRLVSFNHEPSVDAPESGSAREYRRAYRHFASIMHSSAPKVRMVWAVTQLSLTSHGDERPAVFWPGARAVDLVSSNAFNRFKCARKTEPWRTFGNEVEPLLDLAQRYGKHVVISEFGMGVNEHRDRWLRTATRYIERHKRIVAAFYYQSPYNDTCEWRLRNDDDLDAYTSMIDVLR